MAEDAVDPVAPVAVASVEVEVVRVAAVVLVQRAGPVVAVRATGVDLCAVAAARSGEEDGVTVGAGDLLTIDTVDRSPLPRTLLSKFLDLSQRGHAPTTTPLHAGNIVGSTADVGTDVLIFIFKIPTITVPIITIFIGIRGIITLLLSLTPCIVTTVTLGNGGTND